KVHEAGAQARTFDELEHDALPIGPLQVALNTDGGQASLQPGQVGLHAERLAPVRRHDVIHAVAEDEATIEHGYLGVTQAHEIAIQINQTVIVYVGNHARVTRTGDGPCHTGGRSGRLGEHRSARAAIRSAERGHPERATPHPRGCPCSGERSRAADTWQPAEPGQPCRAAPSPTPGWWNPGPRFRLRLPRRVPSPWHGRRHTV